MQSDEISYRNLEKRRQDSTTTIIGEFCILYSPESKYLLQTHFHQSAFLELMFFEVPSILILTLIISQYVRESPRYGAGSETPMHPSRTPMHHPAYMTPMRDPNFGNFNFTLPYLITSATILLVYCSYSGHRYWLVDIIYSKLV